MEFTGYYDQCGIPINVGDLIRVEHYRHVHGRRQMWLYFRVAKLDGRLVVQNWSDLDPSSHQCLLQDCGLETAEVLAENGLQRNERGEIMTFNERPRDRKEREQP
jgi:hypothetical protein